MSASTLQLNASVGNSKKWSRVPRMEGELTGSLQKTLPLYFDLGTLRKGQHQGASQLTYNLCSLHGEGDGVFCLTSVG